MGDVTNAPETRTYIADRWDPVDVPYMECFLIFSSNLSAIIEMDIRKSLLPKRVTIDLSTNKPIIWSLNLGKVVESYCNLLLVDNDHEFYPALLDCALTQYCRNGICYLCMWWPIRIQSCGMWRVWPVELVLRNWGEVLRDPFTKRSPREPAWPSLSHLITRSLESVQKG